MIKKSNIALVFFLFSLMAIFTICCDGGGGGDGENEATLEDFVGTWSGSGTMVTANESETGDIFLTVFSNGAGTFVTITDHTDEFTISSFAVIDGVLHFEWPNPDPDSNDCLGWDVHATLSIDGTFKTVGTVCGSGGGIAGTVSGTLSWSQLAGGGGGDVYEPQNMELYIDGYKVWGRQFTSTLNQADVQIILGGTQSGEDFDGKLDDLRIYNVALTPMDIENIYEDSSAASFNGLVAYYPFNGDADDYSGNNYHGSVAGASLTSDRFNKSNRAYDFDGIDDRILISDNKDFKMTDQLTISFWVYIRKFGFSRIIDKWDQGKCYNVGLDGSDQIWFELAASQTEEVALIYHDNSLLNHWHHITVVFQREI